AIFAKLLEQEGTEIRAIPAPGGGSRKFCDRMNAFAQKEGLPGMGYIFWRNEDWTKTEQRIAKAYADRDALLGSGKSVQGEKKNEEIEKLLDEAAAIRKLINSNGDFEAAGPLAKNIGSERTEA
ncbi:MAG: aspartate--tRNA ligase, partial [Pseudomonadota bacterium]